MHGNDDLAGQDIDHVTSVTHIGNNRYVDARICFRGGPARKNPDSHAARLLGAACGGFHDAGPSAANENSTLSRNQETDFAREVPDLR
jgi:hypothetical protein